MKYVLPLYKTHRKRLEDRLNLVRKAKILKALLGNLYLHLKPHQMVIYETCIYVLNAQEMLLIFTLFNTYIEKQFYAINICM